MIARTLLILLAIIIPASYVLNEISFAVEQKKAQLAAARAAIRADQEAIEVLRAEWSYLNEPGRIEALSRSHLGLTPLDASQIVSIDAIPFRSEASHARHPSRLIANANGWRQRELPK